MVKIAAAEMWDYLSNVTADYTSTDLDLKSQKIITEVNDKFQEIRQADDNSEERVSFSSDSIWYVTVQFPLRSEADIGTLVDWYSDSAKADGRFKTFYWVHPTDGHTYTVRFDTKLERTIRMGDFFGIPTIRFRVLGRKP